MGGIVGREKIKWHQLAPHHLMSLQRPHLVHTVKLTNLRKSLTSGISDVAIASLYLEKTRLKKMIMIIIIMNLSQNRVFHWCQKMTSAMKLDSNLMLYTGESS